METRKGQDIKDLGSLILIIQKPGRGKVPRWKHSKQPSKSSFQD